MRRSRAAPGEVTGGPGRAEQEVPDRGVADPDFDALTQEQLRQRLSAKWQAHPLDVLPAWVATTPATPGRSASRRLCGLRGAPLGLDRRCRALLAGSGRHGRCRGGPQGPDLGRGGRRHLPAHLPPVLQHPGRGGAPRRPGPTPRRRRAGSGWHQRRARQRRGQVRPALQLRGADRPGENASRSRLSGRAPWGGCRDGCLRARRHLARRPAGPPRTWPGWTAVGWDRTSRWRRRRGSSSADGSRSSRVLTSESRGPGGPGSTPVRRASCSRKRSAGWRTRRSRPPQPQSGLTSDARRRSPGGSGRQDRSGRRPGTEAAPAPRRRSSCSPRSCRLPQPVGRCATR